jgi:succinate dehydrogenase / fumarate reductase membrane anchor subunit
MVNRTVIGAHYGTRDWIMQRVTAVVMALYVLLLLGLALWQPQLNYEGWQALFANSAFKLFTFVFLVALFLHAWVGMRDILMDYVKATGVRLTLEVAVIGALVAYTGWAIQILWGVVK